MGQKVLKKIFRPNQDDNVMNMNNQPSGVYFYRVLDEAGSLIGEGKFVKE